MLTLKELLTNEELRRHEFPVCKAKIFLGHAGVCPLPRRVAEAISAYAQQCTAGDQETLLPAFEMQRSRQLAAGLLHARPEEIAFVGPTSLGLSFVAGGLRLDPGDNVVLYFEDYPSNVYPWMALEGRGAQVRFLKVPELGQITLEHVLEQVDDRTRLVALASAHFVSGYRIDLTEIGTALRHRNVLFCVDAIQTLGAFPTTVEPVDFLAADAHKWLLGPCAAGILYVRSTHFDTLQPKVLGWNNVQCPNYVALPHISLKTGARRYEAGSHNLLGLVGLNAAIELLLEIGIGTIAEELLRKRTWVVPALEAKGYTVLNGRAPRSAASGIITFSGGGKDMATLHEKLEAANIATSLRCDRAGCRYIRLSPHFYNTDEELSRVLDLL